MYCSLLMLVNAWTYQKRPYCKVLPNFVRFTGLDHIVEDLRFLLNVIFQSYHTSNLVIICVFPCQHRSVSQFATVRHFFQITSEALAFHKIINPAAPSGSQKACGNVAVFCASHEAVRDTLFTCEPVALVLMKYLTTWFNVTCFWPKTSQKAKKTLLNRPADFVSVFWRCLVTMKSKSTVYLTVLS